MTSRVEIVPYQEVVRYQPAERVVIEAAMLIMGSPTVGAFARTSSVAFAKAIIEAAMLIMSSPGDTLGAGSWDHFSVKGTIGRKRP